MIIIIITASLLFSPSSGPLGCSTNPCKEDENCVPNGDKYDCTPKKQKDE